MPTLTCLSRSTLKEYLSGWTNQEQTEEIESHLAECSQCEQTVIALESDPDTLLESFRDTDRSPNLDGDLQGIERELGSVVERAKLLMDTANQPASANWNPNLIDIGAYELLQPLGRGGMGTVYLARHRQLGKQVAIKLLAAPSAIQPDNRERFLREMRAAGRLNHPSVVAATDAGESQGTLYLVMEHIIGMDLSRLARHSGGLSVANACEIIRQAALGLSHAHSEGIVHRDIKPSNLMLDEAGRVKILDFGLAQLDRWDESSADLTTVGQLMGTLDYMAPEQADRCGGVDYRADLYALGATLFRLLCGRAPLAASPNQSPLEKLRLLANHQPPKLDTLREDAPNELVQLVSTLLARHPEDRPASAAHVAEQLQPFTEGHDLPGLLEQAQLAAERDPQPLVANSLAASLLPGIAPTSNHSNGRNRWRWLIATAALLPFLIVGGILITLEMQKGTLAIKSDVDVQVKLVPEGKPAKDLQITAGDNSFRLYADKYEITIGPSDSLSVEGGQFTLMRSGVAVATIKQDFPTKQSLASSPRSNEPVYEGKTWAEWKGQFVHETNEKELQNAIYALRSLATRENSKEFAALMIEILPALIGDPKNGTGNIDDSAFSALRQVLNATEYYRLIANSLESPDDVWFQRVLDRGFVGRITEKNGVSKEQPDFVTPVFIEIERQIGNVIQPIRQARLEIIGSELFNVAFSNSTPQSIRETATLALKTHQSRFSQSLLMVGRIQPTWPKALHELVIEAGTDAIQNEKTDPEIACEAALMFAQDAPPTRDISKKLEDAVKMRLDSVLKNRERLIGLIPIKSSRFENPLKSSPSLNTIFDVYVYGSYGDRLLNEGIVTMHLARSLGMRTGIGESLEGIRKATEPLHTRFVDEVESIREESVAFADGQPVKVKVLLNWPETRVSVEVFSGDPRQPDSMIIRHKSFPISRRELTIGCVLYEWADGMLSQKGEASAADNAVLF